ncbi:hypothetical protein EYF80_066740 [Liparis tanakae]|uniref:Uncharacterized protein n=1 Tax=Liparis tanakae TaxID=230148 RepID=A0A4Z2E338_9TELE|nr:hypothetical protein EYF80_066740 [Liparis tanakae]
MATAAAATAWGNRPSPASAARASRGTGATRSSWPRPPPPRSRRPPPRRRLRRCCHGNPNRARGC